MKLNVNINRKIRVEMLPLIDVVFLLLVFFIYAMLSMAVHRGLPVALPKSAVAEIERKLVLSITIKKDGSIFLNKQAITLEKLADTLKIKTKTEKNAGALIFADNSTPYQRLFAVLDQLKIAGISRISLQAEKKSSL